MIIAHTRRLRRHSPAIFGPEPAATEKSRGQRREPNCSWWYDEQGHCPTSSVYLAAFYEPVS